MALVRCVECQKEISDSSVACAGCGMPTKKSIDQHEQNLLLNAAIKREKLDLPITNIIRVKTISFLWFLVTFALLNVLNVMFIAFLFHGVFQFPGTLPLICMVLGTAAISALLHCGYKIDYVDSDAYLLRLCGYGCLAYISTFIVPILVSWRDSDVDSFISGSLMFGCGGLFQLVGIQQLVPISDLEKTKPD